MCRGGSTNFDVARPRKWLNDHTSSPTSHGQGSLTVGAPSYMYLSEHTTWHYIPLFKKTGDIQPVLRRNGPRMLMGDFEQITLLRVILENPGIYLQEIRDELFHIFGVPVSMPTIRRTLKYMGCTQ